MAAKPPKTAPERRDTDQSLDAERRKTDEALDKRRSEVEEDSDTVVQRARERASEVVHSARRRADEKLERTGASDVHRSVVSEERAREDAALERERAAESAKLGDEREARKRALASLLRLEREVTDERLQIERLRADANVAARDDFLGMVSHDLRTLLGGIALNAAVVLRHASDDAHRARIIKAGERIQHFTARMNRLIGDLVDVASIDAGHLSVEPKPYDVAAIIRETMEAFQPTAAAKGVSIDADVGANSVLARFDHDRILQVLANLVTNAIKFTDEGGKIAILVRPAGKEVVFAVSDTGVGIPEDQLKPIFERFWQGTFGDRRGLGLGLFISKCIIEAHGGRIWAESTPGKGSSFQFTLPRDGATTSR